jgi:hypothetical protein
MSTAIWGTVIDGKVVPETALPEGAHVQIVIPQSRPAKSPEPLPADLQAEFDAWSLGNAQALEVTERKCEEDLHDASR